MKIWNYLGYGLNIGIITIAPAIVGLLLGKFLDERFNFYPIFTVTLLVLGIFTGLWSMYREVMSH